MTSAHDARLVAAAAAAWTGAAATVAGWRPAWVVVIVSAAALLGGVAVLVRGGLSVRAGVAAAFSLSVGVVVSIGAAAQVQVRAADPLYAAADGPPIDAELTLTHAPTARADGRGWVGRADVLRWRMEEGGEWHHTRAPVLLGWDEPHATPPARFDVLSVRGSIAALDDPAGRGAIWNASIVEVHAPQGPVGAARTRFLEAAHRVSEPSRGVLVGMVLGDTSQMSEELLTAMRVSGLAHLTAVSGAHFAVVTLAVVSAVRAMRAPRPVRAAAVFGAAVSFAALVGPQPSVVRALGMALVVAAALAWGRRARALPALCATVIVLVVVDPWIAREIAFAMSVTAVAAIVLVAPRIAVLLSRVVSPALARVAAIPIAAQLAVAPLIATFDPGASLVAVPANLLAGPFVLPTTLLGVGAVALGGVSGAVAAGLAVLAGMSARPIAWIAEVTGGASRSWWSLPEHPASAVLLAVISAAVIVVISRRALPVVRLAAAGAACGVCVIAVLWTAHGSVPRDWVMVACDVGQGDMFAIRAGPAAAVVIDTGPPGVAASVCLTDLGIEEIPLLILTHPHDDHDGAVPEILGHARVDHAWVPTVGLDSDARVLLDSAGVGVSVPGQGETWSSGETRVTVVSRMHLDDHVKINDASIAVVAESGGLSMLALGDLELEGQASLLRTAPGALDVDVVKIAHHGSAVQDPHMAERVRADFAVFSVGEGNRHGHPSDQTLTLYSHVPVHARTDQCGHVVLRHVAGDGAAQWGNCQVDVAP